MVRKLTSSLSVAILFSASSWTTPLPEQIVAERPGDLCLGYTIIEFGKAIDCDGDTILLTRKFGAQVSVAEFENTTSNNTRENQISFACD